MARIIGFNECNTPDEIAKLFTEVIANQELIDTKVCQLEKESQITKAKLNGLLNPDLPAKKKKGSVLMKTLIGLVVFVVLSFICFGEYVPTDITSEIASNSDMLSQYLRDSFSNISSNSYLFTPTTTTPSAVEGKVYYNDSTNNLLLYNGTSWQTVDVAGGVSLDGGYDFGSAGGGRTILATDGAVQITNTENDTASLLGLTYSGNTTGDGLTITMSVGSGDAIEIENTGTGYDIEGSGALWYAPKTGIVFVTGLIVNTSDLTFQENGETIKNDTDNEVEFTGSEDFSIGLGSGASNQIDFTSDSTATTIDFTVFDTLANMQTITGGTDGDFTIQTTSDTASEDLIISQAGSGAYSVIIQSAGTGVDSISIQATKGIDIDSVDDMAITNTASAGGDDFVITQTGTFDASFLVTSAGTGADAISFTTSNATGDIVINSADMLNIDAGNDILVDLAGAAGEDVIVTNTGGSVIVSATEDIADAIYLNATTGGIDIVADGAAASDLDLPVRVVQSTL